MCPYKKYREIKEFFGKKSEKKKFRKIFEKIILRTLQKYSPVCLYQISMLYVIVKNP